MSNQYSEPYTSAMRGMDAVRHDLVQLAAQRDEWARRARQAINERDILRVELDELRAQQQQVPS